MSGKNAHRLLLESLAKWPKDPLRPQMQLGEVLTKAFQAKPPTNSSQLVKQSEAAQSLLMNRYTTKYRLDRRVMRPKVNPTYFEDLIKDLEEAPNRSWLQRKWLRIAGMIRFR